MKEMSKKESKDVLINLLIYFNKLCRDNDIKYTLLGGSMIGAIRHKGMIPWDDDIDVALTKEEYNKLLNVITISNNGIYKFEDYKKNNTLYYPFLKLIDTRTIVDDNFKKIEDYGAYLDIFCLNNISDKKIFAKFHYYKFLFYKIIISGYATINYSKKTKHFVLKKIGKMITKIIGINYILKCYNKHEKKYNKRLTKHVVLNWPGYCFEKDVLDANDFKEYIDCEFDGVNAMIIKNYDKVLRHTFGNYMEFPPKDQRVNHNMKFYWKK